MKFSTLVKAKVDERGLTRVAKDCRVTTRTLRLWMDGTIKPPYLTQLGFRFLYS